MNPRRLARRERPHRAGHRERARFFRPRLDRAVVIVDALLGTGLDRDVSGFFATLIEHVNRARGRRIALDIPSGLHANTGSPLGTAVRAAETVTFAALKLGLVTSTGAEYAGNVTVVDIGIPASVTEAVGEGARVLDETDVAGCSRRGVATHKGAAGRVVAIAGSAGKTGAALLVARGALRAGAGSRRLPRFRKSRTLSTFVCSRNDGSHRPLRSSRPSTSISRPRMRSSLDLGLVSTPRRARWWARRVAPPGARRGRRGRAHALRGSLGRPAECAEMTGAHAPPRGNGAPPLDEHETSGTIASVPFRTPSVNRTPSFC